MLYLKQNSITNQQQSLADKRHQHLAEELTYVRYGPVLFHDCLLVW